MRNNVFTDDKDNEDPWNFNILRLCAPKNFGELQGFIDQSISKSSTLLSDSHASFARLAQLTTDVAFDTAFVPIRCSFKSLADMDLWNKAEAPLPGISSILIMILRITRIRILSKRRNHASWRRAADHSTTS